MRIECTKAFFSCQNWANVPIDYLMGGTKSGTRIPWLSKCMYFPGTETHTRVKELHYCSQKYSHQEPKCLAHA
jgi:hypothetical protein